MGPSANPGGAMSQQPRRSFLKASAGGLGLALASALPAAASPELTRPPRGRAFLPRRGGPARRALRASRRSPRPAAADRGAQARRGRARRFRPRDVGARPQRTGAGARVPRPAEGPEPGGAGRPLRPLARRRLRHRQARVRRGPQLPARQPPTRRCSRTRATWPCASTTGASASGSHGPRWTRSRPCSGRAGCCGE